MAKIKSRAFDTANKDTDTSEGDGSTVAFVLTSAPLSADFLQVSINGLVQTVTTHYSLSVATVTFVVAPGDDQDILFKYTKG